MRTRTRLVPLIASLVAAAGLATPLVHSQAAGDLAPPRLKYVITDLGLLPGTNQSVPTEINNRGEIIGVSCDTSSSTGCRSFLWSPQPSSRTVGAMADLQLRLPGHVSSEANDINDAGEVVGTSTEDRGTVPRFVGHAVRWRKGQLEELAIPGLSSSAESIDRTGQIVGAGGGGGWIWKEGALSFIKRSDGGSFVPVKTNNSGQIAGIGFTTFGMRGFLWQNGMTTDLGALSLNGSTAPNDINDAGVIVGQSDVEFRTSAGATIKIAHAFLWNGSIHDLGTLPVSPRTSPPPAVANGINDSNQVVGWAEADPLASDGTAGHAVLWQGGTPIDLNETIPADSGWILLRATAINNAGQIVGFGFKLPLSGDDPERAFLLTPVPCAESQDTDGNGNPDNDGDGLCDSWETEGIKASDGDMLLDLPKLGANRNHKDLFVEIDFMDCELQPSDCTDLHTHRPDPQALAAVRQAFADAPVGNPDGTTGITLHFEGDDIDQDGVNEAVPHATQISFRARDSGFNLVKLGPDLSPDGCDGHFGTFGDRFTSPFESTTCDERLQARRRVFRYAIFGHDQAETETPGSSGMGELPGNDFMVTLGGWPDESKQAAAAQCLLPGESRLECGLRQAEAGTFMHELGHTLNLRHGGRDDHNCKPNYLSIMSYARQMPSVIPVRRLDYSRDEFDFLNELSLSEVSGITGPGGPPHRVVVWGVNDRPVTALADGPLDWNRDNEIDPDPIQLDANRLSFDTGFCDGQRHGPRRLRRLVQPALQFPGLGRL